MKRILTGWPACRAFVLCIQLKNSGRKTKLRLKRNRFLNFSFIDRIRPPSVMQQCDYSLFKYKIQPVWEEKENVQGGRLIFQVDQKWNLFLNYFVLVG